MALMNIPVNSHRDIQGKTGKVLFVFRAVIFVHNPQVHSSFLAISQL